MQFASAEVFLPHSQQCGLDLSSKRFRQRMGVDVLANPTSQRSDDSPPLAHAALANAIFLLACHFASTSELPRGHALQHLRPDTIKKELADAEPGFLTRALRGIAAALEAGEAAAIASTSSGSERASLRSSSSSQSIGRSRPGTASPLSRRSASRSPTFGSAAGLQPEGYSDPATPLVDAVQASALLAVYFFAKVRRRSSFRMCLLGFGLTDFGISLTGKVTRRVLSLFCSCPTRRFSRYAPNQDRCLDTAAAFSFAQFGCISTALTKSRCLFNFPDVNLCSDCILINMATNTDYINSYIILISSCVIGSCPFCVFEIWESHQLCLFELLSRSTLATRSRCFNPPRACLSILDCLYYR